MKKSDLKTGMWVKVRNGAKYQVLLNTSMGNVLCAENGWNSLSSYGNDLTMESYKDLDIITVYDHPYNLSLACQKKIWERKEPELVTIKINASICNLEEIKQEIYHLEERLHNIRINLTIE